MVTRLYAIPLSERTSDDASGQVGSQVQQAGLLDSGGTSVTNVATENVDFRKRGRIQVGPTMSKKYKSELDSLSEGAYTELPLYNTDGNLRGKPGYYEIARIDVAPAQEAREEAYTYDVQLTLAGTREDSRRAVETNPQAIDSVYPDANARALVAIPDAATDVRWYDDAAGTEPASAAQLVDAEYGRVARYDPASASFASPTLTYDLAFEQDGPTDVRVYDSRDRDKFAATVSGGEANVWTHVFNEGYQFDGGAVIDTGRFRLGLGGQYVQPNDTRTVAAGTTDTIPNGTTETDDQLVVESTGTFIVEQDGTHILTGNEGVAFQAFEWDATNQVWSSLSTGGANGWNLVAWSFERIRPARVELTTVFSDGATKQTLTAVAERGADRLTWVVPENESAPAQGLKDFIEPLARGTDRLAYPTQGLINRDTRDA